jgi:hypothetical protein
MNMAGKNVVCLDVRSKVLLGVVISLLCGGIAAIVSNPLKVGGEERDPGFVMGRFVFGMLTSALLLSAIALLQAWMCDSSAVDELGENSDLLSVTSV